ncbi:MAG: VapC toxin family PIN domain ribonuclease [Actinobacteria bacterium]|nr:VapC toxin family PIN domain ribonuclease [Actinomycetota bacterium]MBT3687007.1 VapC toxin family PIN domain ribonuclease [Actinomycetota bacterium]MBT4037436.1 VapC toxin family PIN domain ribonuclease [Actinomycetota bacterium]MBT4279736.1 VapC toxin family PIN domain ribonuclease [Actinomycetota bacterium]MBT4342717.1 VapC toxin family PIN domain ribonuclease [Actinomycetota bacterium]
MSRLLLDTTVLIDLERTGHDLDSILLDEDDAAVSAVTVAELEVGVHLASVEHREDRRRYVREVIENVLVLPYDVEVARGQAALLAHSRRTGRPRGRHDLIVAATALVSGRTILSADATAFLDLPGVLLYDS